MICPNINIKEVKDGFNEMVEALGGDPLTDEEFKSSELRNLRIGRDYAAMEAAYRTYHRNNGNMLDKTPDGKNSILFSTLLNHFGGDRSKAIAAKMNVYTDLFINWFGDWGLFKTKDVKYNLFKPSGEINWDYFENLLNLYHNNQPDSMFSHGRYILATRPENHFAEEKNTLNHIKYVTQSMLNLLEGEYDADLPFVSEARASMQNQKDLLIIAAMFHDVAKPYRHGDIHGWESADILRDLLGVDYDNRVAEWAVRHHMPMPFSHKAEFSLSNPEALEVAKNIARDAKRIGIDENTAINAFVLINAADIINGRELNVDDNWAKKAGEDGLKKYGGDISVKNVLSVELKEKVALLKKAFSEIKDEDFGDAAYNYSHQERFDYQAFPEGGREGKKLPYLNNTEYTGVSKVVDENGEPLVVWHGTHSEFDEFNIYKTRSFLTEDTFEDVPSGFFFSSNKGYAKLYEGGIRPKYLSDEEYKDRFNAISEEEKRLRERRSSLKKMFDSVYGDPFTKRGLSGFEENIPQEVIDEFNKWLEEGDSEEVLKKIEKYNKIDAELKRRIDALSIEKYKKRIEQNFPKKILLPVYLNIKEDITKDVADLPFIFPYQTSSTDFFDESINTGDINFVELDSMLASTARYFLADKYKNPGLIGRDRGVVGLDDETGTMLESHTGFEYCVFNPNQIKHVANLGTWSTKNDNIYKMEITDAYKAVLYAQSAVDSDDLFNSGVFELSENGTVNSSNILSKMLSMSKITKDNIELAEILVKHNIPVKLDSSLSRAELAVTETHNGKSIVLINPEILSRVSNQYFNDILLHELIHAVTVDVINNPSTKEEKEFVKQNYKTFSRIKKILGDENNPIFNNSSNYGFAFENEKEFAAYFAADPYFRNEVYILLNKKRNDKGFVLSIKNLVNSITDFFVNKTLFKSDILKLDQYKQTFKNFLYNQESITSDRKLSNKQLIDLYKKQNGSLYDYEATIENYKDLMRLAKAERNFLKRRDLSDMKTASYGDIEQKLTIRIEAIRSSIFDSVTKNNLILSALTQKELFAAGEALRYIAITNILKNSIPTILDDIERIRQAFNGQITLSNSELMYQLHSNIGTYNSIFNTLDKLLIEPGEFLQIIDNFNRDNKDKITIEDLEKIQQDIKNAMSLTQHGINMCEKLILMNGGAILHGVADSVGATPFMDEFVNLLGANKAIYIDDVNLFELTLGAADSSANEAVRAVSHMCQKAAMNAHIKTIPVATRMLELKKALKHKEKVTDLYEKSFDKTFTGRLVRDLNFGLFYKDYDEFIKELNTDINKKYNLNLNVETNRCAPEGDGSEQARSEWESRKNKWLSEHCTRKYIPQYYEIYNNIPQFARNALHDISSQILAIHEKYISKGIVDSKGHFHYEVVSDEDWKSLLILWERRRVLKSDYNEFGQLREVGSPDYNVAKALLKFEKDLNDLRKKLGKSDEEFKKDKDAWKKDREEVIKRCGGRDKYNKWIRGETDHGFDEKTMRKWDERNSRLVFKKNEFGETKVFKDIEDAVEGNVVDFGKAYNDLSEQIREIKRPYRLPNGDVDGDSMPIATRNLLIELYGKRRIEKRKYFNEHPELKSNYEQYIKEFMSKLKYVDTEAFNRIKEEIHKLAEEYYKNNPEFIDSFIDYEDILLGEYGTFVSYDDLLFDDDPTFVPYSWLLRMEAVDFEQYMEYEPGYGYADKEENANIFLDKNSKLCEEYGCTYVPKRSLYDNSEAYNKIKKSERLKALYDYTLETIRSANSLLTNRQYHDDYQLPSITASILSRATRKSTWLHFFRFLKNIFGRFTGLIQDTNNIDYGEDNQKNDFRDELDVVGQPEKIKNRYPDGRQFHMVPQFYTKRMKYPDEISTNLVDIVSSYYNMSCLYDEKSKIKDDVETIVDLIHRQKFDPTLFRRTKDKLMRIFKREPSSAIETVGGLNEDESNTYKLIRNVVERDLYNIKRKKLGNGTEEIVSTLHRWTTARNLGLNPVVAAAGFFTTMWTHTINALTGYRYGYGDAFKAGTIVLGHIAKNIGGTKYIGDRLTGDKLMLIMEAMDLASQFERKTNNAQRDRFIQAIWKNSTFGFLSSVDFTTKALIAVSTLLSYRYVNGLFMTKRDILNMRNGYNEKDIKKLLDQYEGKGEYKGKKVTLYSVLKSGGDDNHQLICDEKYKDAYEKVRYRVFKSAEKYAEQADGMTTSFQKALITRNFLGALALIHRLYISVVLQETMGRQVYDYDTQELKNSQFANMFKFFHQMAMSTTLGSVGTGAFIGIAFGGFGLFPITAGLSIGFVYRMFMKSLGKTKSLKLAKKDMFGDYSSSKNAMISNFNRYQYRQTVLEVLLYNALIVPVANLICSYADDDKDSLLWATLAFWARRVQWETRAKYNAIDIINSMRTLSAATSVSDAVQQIYDDFTFSRGHKGSSIVKAIYDTASGEDEGVVKTGVYTDESKFSRSVQKATPYHNLKEQFGGYGIDLNGNVIWQNGDQNAKRRYNENKIQKLTDDEKESVYRYIFDAIVAKFKQTTE